MSATVKPANIPDAVLVFKNETKPEETKSGVSEYLPHFPFRILAIGPPGSGKLGTFYNILARMEPEADTVTVFHGNSKDEEYAPAAHLCTSGVVHMKTIADIPNSDDLEAFYAGFDKTKRNILVIDEIPTKNLGVKKREALARFPNYCSTHLNCGVFMCFQTLTAIDPALRRGFNTFFIWWIPDRAQLVNIAERVGIPWADFEQYLHLFHDPHDFLAIRTELPESDPKRITLNMFSPIVPA